MEAFGAHEPQAGVPVSIKVRVSGGCFHREHSPEAYRIIDDYLAHADLSDARYRIIEHESGPEMLVYLAAGLSLVTSVINLIVAIIKARADGIKHGDRPSDPLEIIMRGHTKKGEYTEETIMRIPAGTRITAKQLKDALSKHSRAGKKPRKQK
jgi:hypothetical protein